MIELSRVYLSASAALAAVEGIADHAGLLSPTAAAVVLSVVVFGFAAFMAKWIVGEVIATRDAVLRMTVQISGENGLITEQQRVRDNAHKARNSAEAALARVEDVEERVEGIETRERDYLRDRNKSA